MADSPAVKYNGSSTRRFITEAQWKAAGVEGQKDVEWNALNEYAVPRDQFSEEALAILVKDKAFKVPNKPADADAVEVDTDDTKPIVVEEKPPTEGKATTRR